MVSTVKRIATPSPFLALTHAFRQVKWLRNLLDEMGYSYLVGNPTAMLGDN